MTQHGPNLTMIHDPVGHAPNMAWVVLDSYGQPLYRGPEWRAKQIANGAEMTLGEVR